MSPEMHVSLFCQVDTWSFPKWGMVSAIMRHWFTEGFINYSQIFCQKCFVCVKHSVGRGLKVEQVAHPSPGKPFDHLQMDFIELRPSEVRNII